MEYTPINFSQNYRRYREDHGRMASAAYASLDHVMHSDVAKLGIVATIAGGIAGVSTEPHQEAIETLAITSLLTGAGYAVYNKLVNQHVFQEMYAASPRFAGAVDKGKFFVPLAVVLVLGMATAAFAEPVYQQVPQRIETLQLK